MIYDNTGHYENDASSISNLQDINVTIYESMVKLNDQKKIYGMEESSDTDVDTNSCDNDVSGQVDLSDFALFALHYGSNAKRCDYNWDGSVNLQDFAMFAVVYGQ